MNYSQKKRKFNKIVKDIKEIKIQGATNIAKSAIEAYSLLPSPSSRKALLASRPTEPMMSNVLERLEQNSKEELLSHFSEAQNKINKYVFSIIKNGDVILTHCHSTNVVKSLIYSKNKGKKFSVYNTETRPLFQGRKTSEELRKAGIDVTQIIDSSVLLALTGKQGYRKASKVFLGCDAIIKKGIVNKIGSGLISELAKDKKVPLYIIADSWKYSPKKIKLEERDFHEVWAKMSKNSKIKIENPAFEFVPEKQITKIITELGSLRFNDFLKKVEKK